MALQLFCIRGSISVNPVYSKRFICRKCVHDNKSFILILLTLNTIICWELQQNRTVSKMRSIKQFISYMLNDKVKIWYNSNLDSHPGAHIVSSLHLYCRPVTKCQATILRDHFTQLPPLFTSRLPSPTCQPSNCSFTSSTVDRSGALQLWRPWLVWLQSADSHPESRHRRCQVRSHLTPMGAYALSPVACINLQALI